MAVSVKPGVYFLKEWIAAGVKELLADEGQQPPILRPHLPNRGFLQLRIVWKKPKVTGL